MQLTLPKGALFVMERLHAHGFAADAVGGCVRDMLRGAPVNDYDITTDATPAQMQTVFSDVRTIETGIRHGTLTVVYDGMPYEVTTYRTESTYTDHRHPDGVTFTRRLEDDLCRRDFTVNAMCYHPLRGVTDLYGGMDDLRDRVIRCVGDARVRLEEDALRILRALRFSSVLDFSIEEKTAEAIYEKAPLLASVSAERIYTEIRKFLCGVRAQQVFDTFRPVFDSLLPTLEGIDVPCTMWATDMSDKLRFCALFAAAPDAAPRFEEACIRLRTDRALRDLGAHILPLAKEKTKGRKDMLLLLSSLGEKETEDLLALRYAMGTDAADSRPALHALLKEVPVYRLQDLAVDGKTLLSLGFSGKDVGEALTYLLRAVMDGKAENEREALVSLLEKRGRSDGI